MSLRTMFLGGSGVKAATKKEELFARADERLRRLEAQREAMREELSQALHTAITGANES